MRAQWFVGAGVGVFVLGLVASACSDVGESPFDAGTLLDDGASNPDTSTGGDSASPDAGAGDDGAPQSDDAPSSGDQDAPATPDSPSGSDASDASSPGDANDGAPAEDASDASSTPDASDAASAPDGNDASSTVDASDASSPPDAGDASVEDASDASSIADAGEPDARILCDDYDAGTNPILGVVATDDGQTVGQPGSGSSSASAADPVVFVATTSPAGLAQIVQIGFCTGADTRCVSTTPTYVTMTLDADAGAAGDVWTGQIPTKPTGTTVNWFIQVQDVCGTGPAHWHYWSNFGNNFSYTTN